MVDFLNSVPILRSFSIVGWLLILTIGIYLYFDDYNRIPYQTDRVDAQYQPVTGSTLEKHQSAIIKRAGAETAVTPIFAGGDALVARLRLIEQAEHTIDLQYFLIKPDYAGATFAETLMRAADRGVKIRFLLDDVFSTARDDQIRYLAAHANIEIRYFNPLSRRVWRYANYVLDPIKSNRRMHNKSMTVDGAFAIIGGRNIADEYYSIDRSHNFADFDLLITGEAVDQIGSEFIKYWNDEFSVDMRFLLGALSEEERLAADAENKALLQQAMTRVYEGIQENSFLDDFFTGKIPAIPVADSQLVVDQPAKLRVSTRQNALFPVAKELTDAFRNAKSEVILMTPYFVPEKWGTQMFAELAERGVDVRIVTNSLASTNHAYVHGGYFNRRKPLLRSGVHLTEVRADAPKIVLGEGAPELTMHTKLAVIDRETVIVTSLNYDPRSIVQNTELALFAQSEELASLLWGRISPLLEQYTFDLQLDASGNIEWHYNNPDAPEVFKDEPANLRRKLIAWLTWLAPAEKQL